MKKIELKTNIMCSSCVANATPVLNEGLGENNWKVDTLNPNKILTVETDKEISEVVKLVEKAGYKATS